MNIFSKAKHKKEHTNIVLCLAGFFITGYGLANMKLFWAYSRFEQISTHAMHNENHISQYYIVARNEKKLYWECTPHKEWIKQYNYKNITSAIQKFQHRYN